MCMSRRLAIAVILVLALDAVASAQARLQSGDFLKLRSVGAVQWSPDGTRIAYTVTSNDGPGGPYSQLWLLTVATGQSARVGDEASRGSQPLWSPDGRVAGLSRHRRRQVRPDRLRRRRLGAHLEGRRRSAPTAARSRIPGATLSWSPDSKTLAFVHATPGPETADATGDPILITRYLYKPTASEGNTRFNDNRRLHIFLLDVAAGRTRQLTDGIHDEHSIDWSPTGDEILFVSNREPDADQFFNNDLFAVACRQRRHPPPHHHRERRVLAAVVAGRQPHRLRGHQARASPISRRTMEDTHVWTDERRRQQPARGGSGHRQPPGPAGSGLPTAARCSSPCRSADWCTSTAWRLRRPSREPRPERRSSSPNAAPSASSISARTIASPMPSPARATWRSSTSTAARTARRAHRPQRGRARGQGVRRGRALHVRQQRQPVHGRGVPDEAARADRGLEASVDRDDPRRPARPAGAGLQLPEPGLRRPRLGHAAGELPRLDRLRPGVHRRRVPRPERRRGAGRALRRERRHPAQSLDRPRSARASKAAATAAS